MSLQYFREKLVSVLENKHQQNTMEDLEKIKEQKEKEALSLYEKIDILDTQPTQNSNDEPDIIHPITITLSHNSHPLF